MTNKQYQSELVKLNGMHYRYQVLKRHEEYLSKELAEVQKELSELKVKGNKQKALVQKLEAAMKVYKPIDLKADQKLMEKIEKQIEQLKEIKVPPKKRVLQRAVAVLEKPLEKQQAKTRLLASKQIRKLPENRPNLNIKKIIANLFELTISALKDSHFSELVENSGYFHQDLAEMIQYGIEQLKNNNYDENDFEKRFKDFAKLFTKYRIEESMKKDEFEYRLSKIFHVKGYKEPNVTTPTQNDVNSLLQEYERDKQDNESESDSDYD